VPWDGLETPEVVTTTTTTTSTIPGTTTTDTLVPPNLGAGGGGGASSFPWVLAGLFVLLAALSVVVVAELSGLDPRVAVARWRLRRAGARRGRIGPVRSVSAWWRTRVRNGPRRPPYDPTDGVPDADPPR
jgi:amino acid transporter